MLGNLRFVEKWRSKRTYMINYSGYEDREHVGDQGMECLAEELRRVAGGRDIRAARHGMVLGMETWPG